MVKIMTNTCTYALYIVLVQVKVTLVRVQGLVPFEPGRTLYARFKTDVFPCPEIESRTSD